LKLEEKFPQFKEGNVPKAFFVSGKDGKTQLIDHSSLGWDSHRKLVDWIKEHTSYPEDFEKKKKKDKDSADPSFSITGEKKAEL